MEKNMEDSKILAEQWFYQGVEFAQHIPKNQLYAAVGALLLTTIFLFSRRLFRRTKSNTVLLSRLSGSGKTVLFYQVSVYGFVYQKHPLSIFGITKSKQL
uniref:Signal recognition particle receptor subunit beta n=1 Tax=Brassica oleracea TaxID=3712 RepID=A0A3P6DYM9_BRAOL|nr:unnamed protein product [Brassica oleracea]